MRPAGDPPVLHRNRDHEAAPFSRQQRALVYQREVHAQGHGWINHSWVPTHDFRVTIGADCARPCSASIFNILAMSFGALSANAILALNGGAARDRFAHDTGEGSIGPHHCVHGGVLPGPKVAIEIAEARDVPPGQDDISLARHSAFDTLVQMLPFIAQLRVLSGRKRPASRCA